MTGAGLGVECLCGETEEGRYARVADCGPKQRLIVGVSKGAFLSGSEMDWSSLCYCVPVTC